jgi:hypothetical protein
MYYEPPQSYACLGIEEPFEATFDTIRPIDVSIGAVQNGTIYFTCNGSRPAMGAVGTMSAANVVVIPVGSPACRTLRWFEDYGAPVGAERIIHELTVNAPAAPPAINTRGSYVDAVRINSRGPVALLRPGEMFTLEYNHQWWHSNPGAYCPGCIVQSSVSMDYDNADGFISLECANYSGGLYYPGMRVTRRHTLTAPTRPGRYAIRTTISDQFRCRNGTGAYPGGRAVGFIFVR